MANIPERLYTKAGTDAALAAALSGFTPGGSTPTVVDNLDGTSTVNSAGGIVDNGDGTGTLSAVPSGGSTATVTDNGSGLFTVADLDTTEQTYAKTALDTKFSGKADYPGGGTDGQALTKSGSTTAWTTIGAGGTVADATTTSKGIVQLAGDLAGTAAAPTLKAILGSAGTTGTASQIPVISYDTKGRITAISSIAASGGSGSTGVAPPNIFYPETYGAVANGSTDDTSAVQQAVDAAVAYSTAHLATGAIGIVQLLGLYLVSATITAGQAIAMVGLHQTGSGLIASATFTGTRLLYFNLGTKAPIMLDSFSLTDPGTTNKVLELTNTSRSLVTNLVIKGGVTGIRIGGVVHNSRFTNLRVGTYANIGIDVSGDTATAELWFDDIDISDNGNTTAGLAAMRILRTTATDVGGYYLKGVLASSGARPMSYGLLLDASATTAGTYATSPVFVDGGAFDGTGTPVGVKHWGNVYLRGVWLSTSTTAADVVLFDGCTDVQVANCQIRGGTNGIAFRNTATNHVQLINNRIPDATYGYFLESSGIVSNILYAQDDINGGVSGTTITNNWTSLLASVTSSPSSSGPRNQFAAITTPLVTSDSNAGYGVGSRWVNTTTGTAYMATSVAPGAAVWKRMFADVQVFSTAGDFTWNKPSFVDVVEVAVISGGGGGGSGTRLGATTASSGGAGGGGGGYAQAVLSAAQCGATESVRVGTGGSGGAAITVDGTVGTGGSNGSSSFFGSKVRSAGANAGAGGTTAAASSGGSGGAGQSTGGAGGGGNSGAAGSSGSAGNAGGGGGGAGGGITGAGVFTAGGAGGLSVPLNSTASAGGATAGTAGTAGTASTSITVTGGGGGGGGAANAAGVGGTGGAGGVYGAGGGGGGSAVNGNNSGAGGRGADGIVVIVSR